MKDGKTLWIKLNGWESLIIQEGLEGCYFDKMDVYKLPNTILLGENTNVQYSGYWIGLGDNELFAGLDGNCPNPSSQFLVYKWPPRITSNRKYTLQLGSAVKIIMKNAQLNNEGMWSENNDDYTHSIGEVIQKQLSISITNAAMNLNLFIDDYKNGKRSREETSKVIIVLIVKSIKQSVKERHQCLINVMSRHRCTSQNNEYDENEANESELIPEKDKRMKVAPFLTWFKIPLHKEVLSICLKVIVAISKVLQGENITTYTNWRDNQTNVVAIPIWTTKKSFMAMNNKTQFLDYLPLNAKGGKEDVTNQDVVHWILERFGRQYKDVFLRVCDVLRYPVVSRKMVSDTAQAMWDEGNVNIATQRVILRYLRAMFGGLCMIPAMTAITNGEISNGGEDKNIGNYKTVSPKIDVKINCNQVHYWTKRPLLPLLNFSLSNCLYQVTGMNKDRRNAEKLCSIDLVVGGDHGQEWFRMLAKVIARDENKKIIDKFVIKVAHIDCKKDTNHILRDMITPSLNCNLKELTGRRKVVCLYKWRIRDSEYTVRIKDGVGYDNRDCPVFVCPVTNEEMGNEFEYVRRCEINLFVTGDLAFYACALGKVNMSGIWCTWCKLSSDKWSDIDHEKGELWTKDAMDETRESIYGGRVVDKPGYRRGCVDIGLFGDIEVSQYIFPLLHAEIRLGNYLLKFFWNG
jgi:hypothetical protein